MCGRSSDDDGVLTDLERESHKPSNPSTFDEYNEMVRIARVECGVGCVCCVPRHMMLAPPPAIHHARLLWLPLHPLFQAIQWGYIVLFSASFPLAPAVALLNNVIEIRGDAWNHLSNYQRPFPAAARDLGSWYTGTQCVVCVFRKLYGYVFAVRRMYSLVILFSFGIRQCCTPCRCWRWSQTRR